MDEEKVRYISLVRKEGGEPVIGIPYREMSVDPDLVASFVLAVLIFENRQLKTFIKEGYLVLIEEGNHMVGLLIIDKVEDEAPYRECLKDVINSFENKYEQQLQNWKGDIRPFREFALDLLSIFPYGRLDFKLVPKLIDKSTATADQRREIPWSVGETNEKMQTIIGYINGKRTIEEISESANLSSEETIAIFSILDRYNWITLSRPLTEQTRLAKLTEAPQFLVGVYGGEINSFVELCDGSRTLNEICKEVPFNMEVLRTVAKNLIDAGVLGYTEGEGNQ